MAELTIAEVAAIEGVSKAAIRGRIERGTLKAYKAADPRLTTGFWWAIPWPQGEKVNKEEATP